LEQVVTAIFTKPADATPPTPTERQGLKQHWITTRDDLNSAEQENILKGIDWAQRQRSRSPLAIINTAFALRLHKNLFGDVWDWAGAYRTTERNIGIAPHQIEQAIHQMFSDCSYWIENEVFPPDEIAVRLHHRLVAIHPFPNGNGSHSRFMADVLIERLGGNAFSWGGGTLHETSELRASYISALRAADAEDFVPLLKFARN
jgi:Fic-DOC domain mobile mystery protein B